MFGESAVSGNRLHFKVNFNLYFIRFFLLTGFAASWQRFIATLLSFSLVLLLQRVEFEITCYLHTALLMVSCGLCASLTHLTSHSLFPFGMK